MNERMTEAAEALEQEVETLEAIYGEEWKAASNDGEDGNRFFTYLLSPQKPEGFDEDEIDIDPLEVIFMLPRGYPLISPPVIELGFACWWSSDDEEEAISAVDGLITSCRGEPVLFQIIEWLREKIASSPAVIAYFSDLADESRQHKEAMAKAKKGMASHSSITKSANIDSSMEGNVSSSPPPSKGFVATSSLFNGPQITSGPPFVVKRSTFQAHVATVHSTQDVKAVLATLYQNTKIARATHNMFAYRIYDEAKGCWLADCEDDGESQAGSRLAHLLDIQGLRNVVVVVSRWFGGILLGPDRFKHINNTARLLLVEMGYVESAVEEGKTAKKKGTVKVIGKKNK